MGDIKKIVIDPGPPVPLKPGTKSLYPDVKANNAVVAENEKHETGKLIKSHLGTLEVLGDKGDGFVLVATEENGEPLFFSIHQDDI